MSASVYNQILMSDLKVLRTGTASDVCKAPSSQGIAKIRRNLFGPVDHEFNRKFVTEELFKIQSQAAEKWSFDFVNERPLPGRFKWEKVGGSAKVTKERLELASARVTGTPIQIVTTEQPILRATNTERIHNGEVTPPSQIQKTDDGNILTKSSRQPKITNYMKHCKRPISGKKLNNSTIKKRRLTSPAPIS
uniref:Putative cyclin-dependent kinase inhibitor n=1 Tax=Xenopsylla cheopis TaxID=163159 RepID=A0A6M2DLB9_XENCH